MCEKLVGGQKQRYIDRLFAGIAPKYDLLNSVISLGRHKAWRRAAVRMSGLAAGSRAVDVATGTGDFALELARAVGSTGRVVGVDFCGPMLDLAARKLARRQIISLVRANAEHLPFAADAFDCAAIGFALRNVSSVPATIAEMSRVVKPGGRVISLEIVGPGSRLLVPVWRLYLFGLVPRLAQAFRARREPYDYLRHSVQGFCSREELAGIFRECGLVDIRIRDLTFGVVCIHMGTKR